MVCNEEHRFIVAEQMREINIDPQAIILEPFGRNTAPAIAISALKAIQIENDPILLILSSDHLIKNTDQLVQVIEKAIQVALQDKLITFGIVPNRPDDGYGYIETEVASDPNTKLKQDS